jgi:hypothetical protein
MMKEKEDHEDANLRIVSSNLTISQEKRVVNSEEVEASEEVAIEVPLVALVSEAVADMKVTVVPEETTLQDQTICFLTRISQPCESQVESLTIQKIDVPKYQVL